jgi:cysteinyl-tRNA synthetase
VYRLCELEERIAGQSFYELRAPTQRGPFDPKGIHREFLEEVSRRRAAFLECMDDDFNTGGAIGELHELLRALNRFADSRRLEGGKPDPEAVHELRQGVVVLKELSQILGLFRAPLAAALPADNQLLNGLMQLLLDLRTEARKTKQFALADQIRQRLGQLGVILEDRPGGTDWRLG